MRATWNEQYEKVWLDFLKNKKALCLSKIKNLLSQPVPVQRTADDLIMEADFLYMQGALEGNEEQSLKKALICYQLHEKVVGAEHNNLKMRGETLLRLHRYEEAFNCFDRLAELNISNPPVLFENKEISQAWLEHEIIQRKNEGADVTELEKILQFICKDDFFVNIFGDAVSQRTRRTIIQTLPHDLQKILQNLPQRPLYNKLSIPVPNNFLNNKDWSKIQSEYQRTGCVVIDDLFTTETLNLLRKWAAQSPSFQTIRAGFLGAFPSNGANFEIIRHSAEELERLLPEIFTGHPLGLWWFFKYIPGVGNEGIGLHADPAAININIWLTDDNARESGGGLEVYSHVPPQEAKVNEFNREFNTKEEELQLIEKLKQEGETHTIEYKSNRAVLFTSDRYHRSIPFEFKGQNIEEWRLNFTLLYGDRIEHTTQMEITTAAPDQEGWDLF